MSLYDRGNASPNHDRQFWVPLEPVSAFTEDPANPQNAVDWAGRYMHRAGSGLMRSDGTSWITVAPTNKQLIVSAMDGAAGATAGWAVTGSNDGAARLPASQTSSTLVVPIRGLNIGDQVTAVRAIGQVESAGANVTLVMSVRKSTAAVADITDAELGTDNVGTLVADTLISASVLEVAALTETLDALESVYVLLTGTTAALTDIAITGFVVDVTRAA